MNILILVDSEGKENVYHGCLDDKAEHFEVVKLNLLIDALSNKMSFVIVNGAIKFSFELVHPFVGKNMYMLLMRYKKLRTIVK